MCARAHPRTHIHTHNHTSTHAPTPTHTHTSTYTPHTSIHPHPHSHLHPSYTHTHQCLFYSNVCTYCTLHLHCCVHMQVSFQHYTFVCNSSTSTICFAFSCSLCTSWQLSDQFQSSHFHSKGCQSCWYLQVRNLKWEWVHTTHIGVRSCTKADEVRTVCVSQCTRGIHLHSYNRNVHTVYSYMYVHVCHNHLEKNECTAPNWNVHLHLSHTSEQWSVKQPLVAWGVCQLQTLYRSLVPVCVVQWYC